MTDFNTQINANYLMTVGACTVGLNMPEALKSQGQGKDEIAHGLPPYKPRRAFFVDEYPACPKDWMRSTGRIKSYFVPIVENAGLWLDFNYCGSNHTNHVAVVPSIQGVNAITGLPAKSPTLEQFRDACPKHKTPFGPDRLCEACGHKWPRQNYLASTAQPPGEMWLDGFRAEDGFIRQYVFTASKMRGIAKAVIGDDRVFALGISFFLSKQPRPKPQPLDVRGYDKGVSAHFLCSAGPDMAQYDGLIAGASCGNSTTSWASHVENNSTSVGPITATNSAGITYGSSLGEKKKSFSRKFSAKNAALTASNAMSTPIAVNAVQVQQLEVAAGARVAQRIADDPNDLDFWQKEPDGIIVINYCTEADAEKIIAAGKIDLSGSKEGFMDKLPVGNP